MAETTITIAGIPNLPLLQYLKEPVFNISEIYARYPSGGAFGWFLWVNNERTFYYWDIDTKDWKPISKGSLYEILGIDESLLLDGDVPTWNAETKKFRVTNLAIYETDLYFDKYENGVKVFESSVHEIGKSLLNLLDSFTKENVSYEETTTWHDGTPMNDAKVDNVIYRKKGFKYYKRVWSGYVDVRWFGAKGDGVTDDTQAILYAIQNTNGNAIFFPKGRYRISSPIVIKVPLFGIDSKETVLEFTSDSGLIIEQRDGIYIKGLSITHPNRGNGNGIDLYTNSIHKWEITDVFISNFDTAIKCGASWNGLIENITINNCNYGISLIKNNYGEPNEILLISPRIYYCNIGINAVGSLYSLGCLNGNIEHCEKGAYLQSSSGFFFIGTYFENNTIVDIETTNSIGGIYHIIYGHLSFNTSIIDLGRPVKFVDFGISSSNSKIKVSFTDLYRLFGQIDSTSIIESATGQNFLSKYDSWGLNLAAYWGSEFNISTITTTESEIKNKSFLVKVERIATLAGEYAKVYVPLNIYKEINNNDEITILIRARGQGSWKIWENVNVTGQFHTFGLAPDKFCYMITKIKITTSDNRFGIVLGQEISTMKIGDYIEIDYILAAKNGIPARPGDINNYPPTYLDNPPSTGYWMKGEIVYNINPTAGGYTGWVCISEGSPGTWKAFGQIST